MILTGLLALACSVVCRPIDDDSAPNSFMIWQVYLGLGVTAYVAFLGLVGLVTPANAALPGPTAPSDGTWRQWMVFTCTCPTLSFLNGSLAVSIFLGRGSLTAVLVKTACTSLVAGGASTALGYLGTYLARPATPTVDVVITELDNRLKRSIEVDYTEEDSSGFNSEELSELLGEELSEIFGFMSPEQQKLTISTFVGTSTTRSLISPPTSTLRPSAASDLSPTTVPTLSTSAVPTLGTTEVLYTALTPGTMPSVTWADNSTDSSSLPPEEGNRADSVVENRNDLMDTSAGFSFLPPEVEKGENLVENRNALVDTSADFSFLPPEKETGVNWVENKNDLVGQYRNDWVEETKDGLVDTSATFNFLSTEEGNRDVLADFNLALKQNPTYQVGLYLAGVAFNMLATIAALRCCQRRRPHDKTRVDQSRGRCSRPTVTEAHHTGPEVFDSVNLA